MYRARTSWLHDTAPSSDDNTVAIDNQLGLRPRPIRTSKCLKVRRRRRRRRLDDGGRRVREDGRHEDDAADDRRYRWDLRPSPNTILNEALHGGRGCSAVYRESPVKTEGYA